MKHFKNRKQKCHSMFNTGERIEWHKKYFKNENFPDVKE